ncbi:uncharacterized protein A1O5_05633 [Cladophialophora psammophila CBS 110553]|uniref:EthD domain-containing protein n=1 Tax=Cladophialophora psammophila CBS 110553 TaxID=1182543 RepID=W9WV36_9EURO|nr:uncharacterized protein A1O5_05633 [Cladophialophora psammophila CBS 110553]EXJ71823.1 hypothetical protein A1O5_05633 [Cladophialophora psammophila CBS 110553]
MSTTTKKAVSSESTNAKILILFHFLLERPEGLANEAPGVLGPGLRTIYNDLGFDGLVEIQVPLLSMWAAALQDPFYQEYILPDEEKFIDRKVFVFGQGFDVLGVEDGHAMTGGEDTSTGPSLQDRQIKLSSQWLK